MGVFGLYIPRIRGFGLSKPHVCRLLKHYRALYRCWVSGTRSVNRSGVDHRGGIKMPRKEKWLILRIASAETLAHGRINRAEYRF